MARRKHLISVEYPYHVSARSHSGQWFQLPLRDVWGIMCDYLYFIHIAYDVKIHSFVLMSNHFHLIVSTPKGNLSEAMNYFMREVSKEINRLSGGMNQVFGGRYFRSLITKPHYYEHVYKYVYRNPVAAGIVEKCEDYEFSTLHAMLGRSRLFVPLIEDTLLIESGLHVSTLQWLDKAPSDNHYKILKKALRRKEFKLPKNRWGEVLERGRF